MAGQPPSPARGKDPHDNRERPNLYQPSRPSAQDPLPRSTAMVFATLSRFGIGPTHVKSPRSPVQSPQRRRRHRSSISARLLASNTVRVVVAPRNVPVPAREQGGGGGDRRRPRNVPALAREPASPHHPPAQGPTGGGLPGKATADHRPRLNSPQALTTSRGLPIFQPRPCITPRPRRYLPHRQPEGPRCRSRFTDVSGLLPP